MNHLYIIVLIVVQLSIGMHGMHGFPSSQAHAQTWMPVRTRTLFKLVATHWKVKVRLRAISQAHSSLPPGAINWSVLHTLAEAPARHRKS
jgi:hypothetical protein